MRVSKGLVRGLALALVVCLSAGAQTFHALDTTQNGNGSENYHYVDTLIEATGEDPYGHRAEFVELVQRASILAK